MQEFQLPATVQPDWPSDAVLVEAPHDVVSAPRAEHATWDVASAVENPQEHEEQNVAEAAGEKKLPGHDEHMDVCDAVDEPAEHRTALVDPGPQ